MGITEAKETIRACQFCFMCRYACPTFLATKLESVTPRGYALMLATIDRGQQAWSEDMVNRFYQCTLCGLCRAECEYNWPEDELVRHARENIVESGHAPEKVAQAAAAFLEYSSPAWEKIKGLPAGVIGKPNPDVLYLAGCHTRQNNPEIVEANAKILSTLHVDWAVLEDENCCGAPLYDLGYTNEARQAAQQLVDRITRAKPKTVVTGCSHCYRSLKEYYPQWQTALPGDMQVLHTSEYFGQMLAEGKLKLNKSSHGGILSYHDPCQLGRKMGVYDAPRNLIKAATGTPPAELFHHKELAECCGAGSTMFLTNPDVALKVAGVRLERAAEKGTATLVTACQNCKEVFFRSNSQSRSVSRILDLSEFLALHI
jgi:Fe-S oxidoreductase